MSKNKINKVFYTVLFLFIMLSHKAQAGFLDDANLSAKCRNNGQCGLDDVVAGFLSLTRMLLGGIAAIALLFMVWGGVQWVWSGGNADKVKRGKDIFFNTVAALVLAFGSFMILSFFINDVLLGGEGSAYDKYKVVSEDTNNINQCRFKDVGETCNLTQQNYVCTGLDGGERCVTECDLPRFILPEILSNAGLNFRCDNINNGTNAEAYHFTHPCPGDTNNVCILFNALGPVSETAFNANTTYIQALELLGLAGWPGNYR